MQTVAISKLRANLIFYLQQANIGEEIAVTQRGHEIARIMPPHKRQENAKHELKRLQKSCKIDDIISPIDEDWESDK